jgi:hypothetical protein
MGPTRIQSVRIFPRAGGVALRFAAAASLRGQWESALLATVYTARADADGLRPVVRVVDPDGSWWPPAPDVDVAPHVRQAPSFFARGE